MRIRMSTMGTLIWGSSSRGVKSRAAAPASRLMTIIRVGSLDSRNRRTRRAVRPRWRSWGDSIGLDSDMGFLRCSRKL